SGLLHCGHCGLAAILESSILLAETVQGFVAADEQPAVGDRRGRPDPFADRVLRQKLVLRGRGGDVDLPLFAGRTGLARDEDRRGEEDSDGEPLVPDLLAGLHVPATDEAGVVAEVEVPVMNDAGRDVRELLLVLPGLGRLGPLDGRQLETDRKPTRTTLAG